MSSDPIISPDTLRENRLPPGQTLTRKWPVLHAGPVPSFDPRKWDFAVFPVPLVSEVRRWNWQEFCALPRIQVKSDFHCVTRWSRLENIFEGVATRELLNHVKIAPEVRFVMIHCEYGFTTNLPVEDFFGEDCLFAMKHDGADLSPDHGYPLRLVVPQL